MAKERKCARCGDDFAPSQLNQQVCDKEHFKKCENCGGDFPWTKRKRTCSTECMTELRKKSNAEKTSEKEFKECEFDNCINTFQPKKKNDKYCGKKHYKNCEHCNKKFEIKRENLNRAARTCSESCAVFIGHTDESRTKRIENNLNKYGVEYTFQREDVKEKIAANETHQATLIGGENFKESMLNKYGVENISSHSDTADIKRNNFMKKYGVDNPMKLDSVKEKLRNTMLERYGVEHALLHKEFLNKYLKSISEISNSKDNSFSKVSRINKNFAKNIEEEFNVKVEFEKPIGKYAYDLFLPEHNILIEINPTITHNSTISFPCVINKCDLPCDKHKNIAKDYHYKKTLNAHKSGYKLINIYDWDSDEVIMRMLSGKLSRNVIKKSARQLTLKKINQKEANDFMNLYHIQGSSKNQDYCYGLFDGVELVAATTFSKPRFNTNYEWEFNRYAIKGNYIIHGAAGKMLQEFINEVSPKNIISYIDFNHSTGKSFLEPLGFIEKDLTGPTLIWFNSKNKKTVKQTSLNFIGADRLLKTNYGSQETSGMNNKDIMLSEGFVEVYTAGNRVFIWGDNKKITIRH